MNSTAVFWHGHPYHLNADLEKWEKTKRRDQAIRDAGFNLVTITSCEWLKMPESKQWYHLRKEEEEIEEELSEEEKLRRKREQLLGDICSGKIFGFVKCDICVRTRRSY